MEKLSYCPGLGPGFRQGRAFSRKEMKHQLPSELGLVPSAEVDVSSPFARPLRLGWIPGSSPGSVLSMALVVQKYGGTSVGTPEKILAVARRIAQAHREGTQLVVVVSAMGHTTDELISLAGQVSKAPPRREMDMLLSTGERISMALLSMALSDLGVKAISLTGSQSGIITDTSHRRARILRILGDRLREGLAQGHVVIVAGFQGVSEAKEITTLGRGGSDTTAVALAATLKAERCEIYTDVDGVYSADPRVVPDARLWKEIRHDHMVELAARGAGILHLRSVQLAARFRVPLWVLNSAKGGLLGTQVVEKTQVQAGMEQPQVVGVTCDLDRVLVQVVCARPTAIAALWDRAREGQLPLYAPLFSGTEVLFFCEKEMALEWKAILDKLTIDGFLQEYRIDDSYVPLAVVGDRLTQDGSALSEIYDVLAKEHVEARAGFASPLALTFVVPAHRAKDVVRALHARFQSRMDPVTEKRT